MSKLIELIQMLKNDEQVLRFQELEMIIDHNVSIKQDFDKLLHLQKIMVQKEFKKESSYLEAKQDYDRQFEVMMQYPIIEEYLDLLDIINSDLNMIKKMIEEEIALDFD